MLFPLLARATVPDSNSFFEHCFAANWRAAHSPARIPIALPVLAAGPALEIWRGAAPTHQEALSGGGLVANQDFLSIYRTEAVSGRRDIESLTREIYSDILERQRTLGYPYLLRTWNIVPAINQGSDDQENYVRFAVGRGTALDACQLAESSYCAATCVGAVPESPLTVIAVASRAMPVSVENPRQISAYHYPRRYGPRAPSFARATMLPHERGATLFISGTASIVGHESKHAAVDAQLQEALVNVHEVRQQALALQPQLSYRGDSSWRIYLRDPADLPQIVPIVEGVTGSAQNVVYLHADLCRRDLKVEIEGACELLPASTPA